MEKAIALFKKELIFKEKQFISYTKAGIATDELEKTINSLKYAISFLDEKSNSTF